MTHDRAALLAAAGRLADGLIVYADDRHLLARFVRDVLDPTAITEKDIGAVMENCEEGYWLKLRNGGLCAIQPAWSRKENQWEFWLRIDTKNEPLWPQPRTIGELRQLIQRVEGES